MKSIYQVISHTNVQSAGEVFPKIQTLSNTYVDILKSSLSNATMKNVMHRLLAKEN